MTNNLISARLKDKLAKIDNDDAFQMFYMKYDETSSFADAFQYVADKFDLAVPEVEFLYRTNDWAMKVVDIETQNAMVEQIKAKNSWLQDSKLLYKMGQGVIMELFEDFEKGVLPFNVDKLREDPRHMKDFVKIMETLSSIKMTGSETISKQIIVNHQHNEETTNNYINAPSDEKRDRVNRILDDEAFIVDGKFVVKEDNEDEF